MPHVYIYVYKQKREKSERLSVAKTISLPQNVNGNGNEYIKSLAWHVHQLNEKKGEEKKINFRPKKFNRKKNLIFINRAEWGDVHMEVSRIQYYIIMIINYAPSRPQL